MLECFYLSADGLVLCAKDAKHRFCQFLTGRQLEVPLCE